jgi:AraC-like DNA-binding protein
MAERSTFTFSDPDSYAAAFGDPRINLTITGAGDFRARLSRLNLKHLEIYWLRENLPRIAYLSLPPEQIYLSFPVGSQSLIFAGFACRNGDIVLLSRGEHIHQRSSGECQWGLVSLSPEQLENHAKALKEQPIASPDASRILRPVRADASQFKHLFRQACQLADSGKKLIELPDVARALERELFYAIIRCLAADEADDNPRTRHYHAAVMVRLEETLRRRIDQRPSLPELSAEVGVPERTLRMCCAEFLGVSPTRYLLLQRLNRARSALRLADPSTASVSEIARNHQFTELGRFAVRYRTTFGETPSTTLERGPQSSTQPAESA